VWIGSGLGRIDGLTAGDPVTAEQIRALFACGLHPLAELRQQQLEGPDLTIRDFQEVTQLGAPFKISDGDVSPFRLEVAKHIGAINTAAGLPVGARLPAADRARVRTEVAREFFLAEHGREPMDARELAGQIAKNSRPQTQTVAGYDLTFSPVKSASALWAVAEPAVAAAIEQAGTAGLDCDQVRVATVQAQRCVHAGDHRLSGQGAMQQQHFDQGTGAGPVAEPAASRLPEPLMITGEHPRCPGGS